MMSHWIMHTTHKIFIILLPFFKVDGWRKIKSQFNSFLIVDFMSLSLVIDNRLVFSVFNPWRTRTTCWTFYKCTINWRGSLEGVLMIQESGVNFIADFYLNRDVCVQSGTRDCQDQVFLRRRLYSRSPVCMYVRVQQIYGTTFYIYFHISFS